MGSNTSNIDDQYFDDTLTIKQLVELYKTRPSDEELEKKKKYLLKIFPNFSKTTKPSKHHAKSTVLLLCLKGGD